MMSKVDSITRQTLFSNSLQQVTSDMQMLMVQHHAATHHIKALFMFKAFYSLLNIAFHKPLKLVPIDYEVIDNLLFVN